MGKFLQFLNESKIDKARANLTIASNESLGDWFTRNETKLEDRFEELKPEKFDFPNWFEAIYFILHSENKAYQNKFNFKDLWLNPDSAYEEYKKANTKG